MFTEFSRDVYVRGDGTKIRVPGRLEFTVAGQDVSLVSGLRRSIMCDVPTLAFRFDPVDPTKQDVRVLFNTGSLHNEFVGDRVGLLPLHFSKADLLDAKPGSWRFELDAENASAKPVDVTTAAFKINPVAGSTEAPPNPANVFKADALSGDHALVTTLMPGQRLALEATATFGLGSEHARFNPVAACSCYPVRDEAAVQKARKTRDDKPAFDALDAHRIIDVDEKGAPRAHRFCLETQCGMSPEEIVQSGYEHLASRLRRIADACESATKVLDVAAQTGSPHDIVSLKILDEDHTAGAIAQTQLLRQTAFAGFYIPHQLERSIVVRMRVADGVTARGMLKAACESAAIECEEALSEWNKLIEG